MWPPFNSSVYQVKTLLYFCQLLLNSSHKKRHSHFKVCWWVLRSSFLLQGPHLQTQPLFQWTIFLRGRAAKGRSKKNSGEYIVCRLYSEQVGYRGWKSFNYFACSSFTTMVGTAALRVSLTNCSIASEWVLSSWSLEEEDTLVLAVGCTWKRELPPWLGPQVTSCPPTPGGRRPILPVSLRWHLLLAASPISVRKMRGLQYIALCCFPCQ